MKRSPVLKRRELLKALASGVLLGSTGLLGMRAARAQHGGRRFFLREDSFGRIFPRLEPFAQPSAALTAALVDIGKPGGILDAKDNLAAGPVALITDPGLSMNNANNLTHTAGTTFMGHPPVFPVFWKREPTWPPARTVSTRLLSKSLMSAAGNCNSTRALPSTVPPR